MSIPVIDKRKCPAQATICPSITACPQSAIAYEEDQTEPLGGKIVIDYTLCDGCAVCVEACCGQAIVMN